MDTAYVYHGANSEVVVGKALRQGYRSRVYMATKCPVWSVTRAADFDRYLDEQLARLQTDCIDFYSTRLIPSIRPNSEPPTLPVA